jgi:hypothetical protein
MTESERKWRMGLEWHVRSLMRPYCEALAHLTTTTQSVLEVEGEQEGRWGSGKGETRTGEGECDEMVGKVIDPCHARAAVHADVMAVPVTSKADAEIMLAAAIGHAGRKSRDGERGEEETDEEEGWGLVAGSHTPADTPAVDVFAAGMVPLSLTLF